MKLSSNKLSSQCVLERPVLFEEFYDPLLSTHKKKISLAQIEKKASFCKTLFDDDEEVLDEEMGMLEASVDVKDNVEDDFFLKKIIQNSKFPNKVQIHSNDQYLPFQNQSYAFNNKIIVKYPQTPHFRHQLQSPFYKFNAEHKNHMEILKTKTIKSDFVALEINTDPSLYINEAIKYFIGLAMHMKEYNCINEARIFLKLACYVEPFNQKAWKKYIEFQEQHGFIYKSSVLSKTAFLFTKNQQFAKSYLSNGQKAGLSCAEMKGILNSVSCPDIFEKTVLIQLTKLHLKYDKISQGVKILYEICQWNQFKLAVCCIIIFLSKYLQNIGYRELGLAILKKSFNKNMSKLEIYTTYLEMKLRDDSYMKDATIKEVLDYVECISSENRYRLYLEIAEVYFYAGQYEKYAMYIEYAFSSAKRYCAAGSGCNKILKMIYFSVLKCRNLYPLTENNEDQNVIFQNNRYLYVYGYELKEYEFSDWKYYLHYGLFKRDDLLLEASKKWPYTGRLVAQWIHAKRTKHSPQEMLAIWREKIEEVPKSGELWCEGGRIYAQLQEYDQASWCFRTAIHFTPQYGDSFIEQLKILLMKSKFYEVNKLKKLMLVCEPFYGHVWSFLRESRTANSFTKPSTKDMWDLASQSIKLNLYKVNLKLSNRQFMSKFYKLMTAYEPYNQAFLNQDSYEVRVRLFASYQQLENKN